MALAWALAEAERRGAELELVRVTGSPADHDGWMLDDALAQIGASGVRVRAVLVRGRPERELRRAAASARLLVLGAATGNGGAPRTSVPSDCIRNAPCQAVVLRADGTVAELAGFPIPGAR